MAFLPGRRRFFADDLFFQLDFEVLNIIHMLDQFFEGVLFSLEVLFNLFLVFLHPANQVFFFFASFLTLLFLQQLWIISLRVSKVFFIDVLAKLCGSFGGSDGNFSSVNILDSWQILGSSEVAVASKARDLPALRIEHLGVLDSPVVVSA